jgi:hypothetical protein
MRRARKTFVVTVVALAACGLGASASAQAATITAQLNGEQVAGVPLSVTVSVSGAPSGTTVYTAVDPAAPAMSTYPVDPTRCPSSHNDFGYPYGYFTDPDERPVPGPDFTFTATLLDADIAGEEIAGPLRLCVVLVEPRDSNNNLPPPLAAFSLPFTARAPRGSLAVTRARWSAATRTLTFAFAGSSESKGNVDRYLLRTRRCPAQVPHSLDQTPAFLGELGPPQDAPGHFAFKRRLVARRAPPPGTYRLCAYLESVAGTTQEHYSLILMARAHATVRITRS